MEKKDETTQNQNLFGQLHEQADQNLKIEENPQAKDINKEKEGKDVKENELKNKKEENNDKNL